MAQYAGMFYGYREAVLPVVGRVMLPPWEIDGKVPHAMEVFQGDAADAYTTLTFSEQSETLLIQTWKQKLIFRLSQDGITYQDETTLDPGRDLGSWYHRFSAKSVQIKNEAAGANAEYQVVNSW